MSELFPGGVAAVPFMTVNAEGRPSLIASRCDGCGVRLFGTPMACAACGGRMLSSSPVGENARLHTWTIVHRSFPGVRTPFVAAVVDLEGGGSLKGTVFDVVPDPAALHPDMPLRLVFRDSGQCDTHGRPFIAYGFVPRQEDVA